MKINFKIESFSLVALDTSSLPFALLSLQLMEVNINKGNFMTVNVKARELNGSFFENVKGNELIERKMIGELDKTDTYEIDNNNKGKTLDHIMNSLKQYTQSIADKIALKQDEQENPRVEVEIILYPGGDKIINVELNHLKLFLVTASYLQLVNFVAMDDSVVPPPPKVLRDSII